MTDATDPFARPFAVAVLQETSTDGADPATLRVARAAERLARRRRAKGAESGRAGGESDPRALLSLRETDRRDR